MINASLEEMFVGRLRFREEEFRHAPSKIASVRQREKDLKKGWNRGGQRDGAPTGHPALPRFSVGHSRDACDAQSLDQAFVSGEEECFVFANRAADGPAELIALESGNPFIR